MPGLTLTRQSFFWKLFASYGALLLVTAGTIGLLVDRWLTDSLRSGLEESLSDGCELLSPLAERAFRGEEEGLQAVLVRLGEETGLRITLIQPSGRVLGDSDEDPVVMDDHGNRPEVLASRDSAFGISERYSRTVGKDMVYAAHRLPDELGIVRVAVPLEDVDQQLAAARRGVVSGSAIGFAIALVLGWVVARRSAAPIREMTAVAEDLRAGKYDSRVRSVGRDEVGILGDTLNRLAAEVTERIATISQDDAQLRAMLAGMVEGVVAVDEEDRVVFCNQAARRLLAMGEGEPVGRRVWELAPIVGLGELLEEARSTDTPRRAEIEFLRSEREHIVDVHASRFRGGGRTGIVVVVHDITELRRLERIRRDFVANVSHELKTPLTSIKGFVETLLSGALHDEQNNERFLKRIDANVDRLTHLVTDLLSLARVESQEDPHRTLVDWRGVVREVTARHEDAARRKRLTLDLDAEEEVVVLGDREAMVQVYDNLLDNAIKYTPAPGRVDVRLWSEDGHGLLEVRDTGIGIPAADTERVFERFYRVDKARSREIGGTGLGLSIVKNLVLRMDGEVRIESEEDHGTRFVVDLPMGNASQATV